MGGRQQAGWEGGGAVTPITQPRNLKGQRFGSLTVLDFLNCRSGKAWWSCLCDCAGPHSQIIVRSDKLVGGQTYACKCRTGHKKTGVPIGTKMPRQAKPELGDLQPAPVNLPRSPQINRVAFSPAKLLAAELLSARQMRNWKCPWPDIAEYLALSRTDGCTVEQAQALLAA